MNKKILCSSMAAMVMICNGSFANDLKMEDRIKSLEEKIAKLEKEKKEESKVSSSSYIPQKFIPDISVILNGSYSHQSQRHTHIRGFQVPHHGEKGDDGFSLGESEINISANADDKFRGSLTFVLVDEHGDEKIEIEEAYIETLSLPYGMSLKAGRMMPVFGYLNNKHLHTDDFYDRPLPNRVYMGAHYIDDGIQASIVLPTDFYAEIGGGAFRGGKFPADAGGGGNIGAYTAYAKVGSDIGVGHSWQLGTSYLHAKSKKSGRSDSHDHGHSHHDLVFRGDDDFYGVDFKYAYAPNGNNREREFILQGEYIMRDEDGQYDVGHGFYDFDSSTNGWYAQAIYKFLPEWRIGYRYSELNPKKAPLEFQNTLLDDRGHKPKIHSAMVEWNNSEFSRIRLQYNYDQSDRKVDNQFIVQYTISFGAHGAHSF